METLRDAPAMPPPPAPPAPADEYRRPSSSFQDLDISSGGASGSAGGPSATPRFDAAVGGPTAGGGSSPDLAVTVGNPTKQGEGMSAFFSYEVRTKTSLPQYAFAEFTVIRRFRDFDWLHSQLCHKFPGAIVPPLPEKHSAQVSTYRVTGQAQSATWLEDRRSQLQRFLHRLVAHPMLHTAPDLQAFLEKAEDALDTWKERSKPKSSGTYSLADVKSGLLSVSAKSISLFNGESAPTGFIPVTDLPCQQMGNYTSAMQAQVASVHKHAHNFIERHRALSSSMTDFGLALSQLANCEKEINESLHKGMSCMGLCVGRMSAIYKDLADRETASFDEPMKEYVRVLTAVKAAIGARELALRAYNSTTSTMLAKKARASQPTSPTPALHAAALHAAALRAAALHA